MDPAADSIFLHSSSGEAGSVDGGVSVFASGDAQVTGGETSQPPPGH